MDLPSGALEESRKRSTGGGEEDRHWRERSWHGRLRRLGARLEDGQADDGTRPRQAERPGSAAAAAARHMTELTARERTRALCHNTPSWERVGAAWPSARLSF